MDTERLNRIRLYNAKGIGSVTFYNLLARFGSATDAIDALPHITRNHKNPKTPLSIDKARAILDTADKHNVNILIMGDAHFPPLFGNHPTLPPMLYTRGHTSLLSKKCIAIVGARNASPIALRYAYRMAEDLGKQGMVIVSGMARGIDTHAHQGALASGTIAVQAGCITIPYPKENQDLYDDIVAQGCIISESPIGTPPNPNLFAIRNRLIAGLSAGTLIVEAELKSGSLITAQMASDMGREVFAIPGSPANGRARGCNQLIKDGATLVETPQDILDNILSFDKHTLRTPIFTPEDFIPEIPSQDIDSICTQIIEILTIHSMDMDTLIRTLNMPAGVVRSALLELELSEVLHITQMGLVVLNSAHSV